MADEDEAFPTLDAADMALVTQLGVRRQVQEGEYLFREGDVTYDFFVLVSAEVDIVVAVDGGERVIVRHGPGRFLGELNMLSGLRVFVSARVVTAGRGGRGLPRPAAATDGDEPSAGRHHPGRLRGPARAAHDGGRAGDPGHRVAVLARIPPYQGVPDPDPGAPRVAGCRS